MEECGNYTVLLHPATFARACEYQKSLIKNSVAPGNNLKKVLLEENLQQLNAEDFLELLVNTKYPQIFAESSILGDGHDWNRTELSILGDISIAVKVMIYDDGRHSHPAVHEKPFRATLIYTPGALLRNDQRRTPADYNAVTTDGRLDPDKYFRLYERRLLPGLLYANHQAELQNIKAFITLPGLGCGCFAGSFRGQLEPLLGRTIERILKKHWQSLPNLRGVYYDPYSQEDNSRVEISHISFLTRPYLKGNNISQLSEASAFENGEFADCALFSIVAWDHVSWPGNDFYGGSRATDDGVKAAATDSMLAITGTEGRYNRLTYSYDPPAIFLNWGNVVQKTNIRIKVARNLMLLPPLAPHAEI